MQSTVLLASLGTAKGQLVAKKPALKTKVNTTTKVVVWDFKRLGITQLAECLPRIHTVLD